MRRLLPLVTLLLIACPAAEDADGDGFDVDSDCDDGSADVHPGAVELCNAIDDDCDGAVDNDPADAVTGYADADEDGFGDPDSGALACTLAFGRTLDATDCDDTREDVNPEADELCDDVDHDCDGAPTDGAIDPTTWYADTDDDTYGDASSTTDACDAPADHVADDSDCDDTRPEVNPAATEVDCNALDDDCDGTTDVNSVPTDHATIQDAVDALPDGSTICLQPGAYTERLDLATRELSFVGGGGPDVTIFDIGSDLPLITASVWNDDHEVLEGDVADLAFTGITVTGTPWTTTDDIAGGFLRLGGGSVRFEDVVVTGIHVTLLDGADVEGLLVDADAGTVDVVGLEASDVGFTFAEGDGDGTKNIDGGIVDSEHGGHVDIQDATAVGLSVATQDAPSSCYTDGVFVRVQDGSLTGAGWLLDGGTLDQDCSGQSYVNGVWMNLSDSDSTLDDVTVSNTVVHVESSSSAYIDGVAFKMNDGSHTWSNVDFTDNSGTTTNDQSSSYALGVVWGIKAELDLTYSSFLGNDLRAIATGTSTSGTTEGALTMRGRLDMHHVEILGNSSFGDDRGNGGGVYWREDDDVPGASTFTNLIVAGNTAEGGEDARGGGMYLSAEADHLAVAYSDVVGNAVIAGTDTGRGGGIYDISEADGGSVGFTGVCIANNTIEAGAGGEREGEQVYVDDDDPPPRSWTYNNVFGPGAIDLFEGMDDPTGSDGNISAEPLHTSVAGDPATWDLTLQAGSPNVGAADPNQTNADGSTASIGAYGGPDAAWPE